MNFLVAITLLAVFIRAITLIVSDLAMIGILAIKEFANATI